mmetsp:Transcript_23475/g.42347  ORF Transcript_23475/g.42347 Transcript_23475/m.42347 type:complete len:346 (-) Transcript_23475:16-1053(-)
MSFLQYLVLLSAAVQCAGKILFFWAVDSQEKTQSMVINNYNAAAEALGKENIDVALAHYKGSPSDWPQVFYKEAVGMDTVSVGYKFGLLKRLYKENKGKMDEYEYIWALDTDIDFRSTDLNKLFETARKSESLIVGPTFHSPGGKWARWTLLMRKQEQDLDLADISNHASEEDAVRSQSAINILERPNPDCDYRHTDFVEITAAILSSRVLPLLLEKCTNCIHEESDWGFDMVWCNMAEDDQKVAGACALLDATPVTHLSWKSAQVTKAFKDANKDVMHNYRKYWSKAKALDCWKNGERNENFGKSNDQVPSVKIASINEHKEGAKAQSLAFSKMVQVGPSGWPE